MTDQTLRLTDGTTISRLGYGAMQLTGRGVWGPPKDRDTAVAVLRRAVELGVTFVNSAHFYGPRVTNQLIGEALRDTGGRIVVGNKIGVERPRPSQWVTTGDPDALRRHVQESREDLGDDATVVTILRLGGDGLAPESETPFTAALETLLALKEEGELDLIGLSGATPAQLDQALKVTPVELVENRFNLTDRSGGTVLADCETHGVAFLPYFPLGNGALPDGPALTDPAARLGVTPAQVTLGWLLRVSPVLVPIPGTGSVAHLEENVAAAAVADQLTDAEVDALTALA